MSATKSPVPEATQVEALLHAAAEQTATAAMYFDDVLHEHIKSGDELPEFADAAKLLGMAHVARRSATIAVQQADLVIAGLVNVYHLASESHTFPEMSR